jgi:hypothetical protein
MKNIVTTGSYHISLEMACKNLAAKLTGADLTVLPRTHEGVVQYLAEHLPSMEDLTEAVAQEVIARLADSPEFLTSLFPPQEGGTDAPEEVSTAEEETAPAPKKRATKAETDE